MPDELRYRPMRIEPDLDDRIKALAEAKMGGNVSKMLRALLEDAVTRAEQPIQNRTRVTQRTQEVKSETPTPAPAKATSKAEQLRQMRENRYR